MIPSRKELLRMLDQFLRDHNRPLRQQLNREGKLKAFLEEQATAIMESYEYAMSEVLSENLTKDQDPLERIQKITMGRNRAWSEALEEGLDSLRPNEDATILPLSGR